MPNFQRVVVGLLVLVIINLFGLLVTGHQVNVNLKKLVAHSPAPEEHAKKGIDEQILDLWAEQNDIPLPQHVSADTMSQKEVEDIFNKRGIVPALPISTK